MSGELRVILHSTARECHCAILYIVHMSINNNNFKHHHIIHMHIMVTGVFYCWNVLHNTSYSGVEIVGDIFKGFDTSGHVRPKMEMRGHAVRALRISYHMPCAYIL